MDRELSCGIIGCGVIAPTHAESYKKLDGVQIKWACDLVEEKALALAGQYGIPRTTTRYKEVFEDPDVDCISVCTDHASHAPVSVAALESGKNVLCEKALGATQEDLDAMLEAHANRSSLVFSGVFQHRFDPVNRTLKWMVDEGMFGQLLTAGVQMRCLRTDEYYDSDEWRGTWAQEGGSVLINQTIHFIDALLWIVGGAESVAGHYTNLTHNGSIETEDCAVASLKLNCGALGIIEATSASHLNWEPTISIHGTEGSVELRNDKPLKIEFADPDRQKEVQDKLASGELEDSAAASKGYYGVGHPAQIADFIEAVRNGREPYVPAESARHAVDVVLGIYRSHREKTWIPCSIEAKPGKEGVTQESQKNFEPQQTTTRSR
ncbi:MAG: Gfo/Idh/MocA family oxidoreductase [Planctomycetes bacterium]|nr:Gfo/Idh/MocA family oxidoreductase [Planctomycetota bacterium]